MSACVYTYTHDRSMSFPGGEQGPARILNRCDVIERVEIRDAAGFGALSQAPTMKMTGGTRSILYYLDINSDRD